ncbi:MAG: glucose dehydrogenase, partial [Nitrospiria bacterium]
MNLPRAIGSLAWALVAIHCTPLPAALGQTTGEWPALSLERRVGGLIQPVHIAHAGDGSGRLFVVEQRGVIRVVKRGALSPTPFLNISARVACCEEQGLLSVA